MKKIIILSLIGVATMSLLTGCDIKLGGGTTTEMRPATVGQQLVDLKKAKDDSAISDEEYQTEKARILNEKP